MPGACWLDGIRKGAKSEAKCLLYGARMSVCVCGRFINKRRQRHNLIRTGACRVPPYHFILFHFTPHFFLQTAYYVLCTCTYVHMSCIYISWVFWLLALASGCWTRNFFLYYLLLLWLCAKPLYRVCCSFGVCTTLQANNSNNNTNKNKNIGEYLRNYLMAVQILVGMYVCMWVCMNMYVCLVQCAFIHDTSERYLHIHTYVRVCMHMYALVQALAFQVTAWVRFLFHSCHTKGQYSIGVHSSSMS